MWPLNVFAGLILALVICRWLFAARLFGSHLAGVARLTWRQARTSSLRLYLASSVFGVVSAPLSAAFDMAPPGIPFLSSVLGMVGIGTVGLPPSFLLLGGSGSPTLELTRTLRRIALLSRTVHMLLLPEGSDPTGDVRSDESRWRKDFTILARAAKVVVLDTRGNVTTNRRWEIDWLARHASDKTVALVDVSQLYSRSLPNGLDAFVRAADAHTLAGLAARLLRVAFQPLDPAVEAGEEREESPTEPDRAGADHYIRCPRCRSRIPLAAANSVIFCNRCSVRLPRLSLELGIRLLLVCATALGIGSGLFGDTFDASFRVGFSLWTGQFIETAALAGTWQHRTRLSPLFGYGTMLVALIVIPPAHFRLLKPWVLGGFVVSNLSSVLTLRLSLRAYRPT